jgi:ribose 5-phosphate isomerase B
VKIALAADHGGFELKEHLKQKIESLGHEMIDLGCSSAESVDYPDYGLDAAKLVSRGKADRAILLCKSGIGMSIVANKVQGVRGALCMDEAMAESSRRHNDANVLILSANYLDQTKADKIVGKWLATDFEGGRHQRRIEKITEFEKNQS